MHKGTCCHAWLHGFDPWDPHGGRGVWTPSSSPCSDSHINTHINKQINAQKSLKLTFWFSYVPLTNISRVHSLTLLHFNKSQCIVILDSDQSHLHISLVKIVRISTHGDKLALISRLLGTVWMNAVINIPCWFGNAVIYFNSLPDGTGLLNDFAHFMYILPGAAAACPQTPSDSLQPREQGSHFYQWEDPESADSEGLAGGSGREAGRKWKRAPGLAVSNWVQAGPSSCTAISPDLFVGLCSMVGGDFRRVKEMTEPEPRAQRPGNRVGMRWKERAA